VSWYGGYGGGRAFGGMGGRTFGLDHMRFSHDGPPVQLQAAQLRRIAGYLIPYWRAWLLILACVASTSVIGLLPPLIVRAIIDHAIPYGEPGLLNLLVLAMLAVPVVNGLIGVAQNYLNVRVGQGIMFDLRNQLYAHLQRMSLRFYTATRTGEIMSRVSNDVNGVQGVVTGTLVNIVTNAITVLSTLVVIFAMNWRLALLALVVLPAFVLPTRGVGRIRHRISRQTQEKQAELTSIMQETLSISGFILAKIFGREAYERERFRRKNLELMALQIKQAMVGRWFFMALGALSAAGPAVIYWYGGHLAIRQELSVGTVVAFVAYLSNLYRPVTQLANIYVDIQGALAVFDRIFEYLDMRPEIEERPNAIVLPPVKGRITFEHVSFAYHPLEEPQEDGRRGSSSARSERRLALDDVSFDIQPGQLVALVGPSGAGKTTITYLVPRFYDPTAGRVLIDGYDVRDVTLDSLARQIAMVTQETFLFHASLRDNLLYANPDATEEQMIAACKAAYIHDFIMSLPQGYDTVVGERGFRLSGGEKQRVSIARAILKNPRILILDEATSALDSTSEALIQAALEPLMKGRTSLVIAHRLSTILAADLILVLDRGRLVEQGTHEELLARNGLYARLYRLQFRQRTRAQQGELQLAPTAPVLELPTAGKGA
jgi:ATP-binding cassette subfamily B protein